MNPLSSQMPVTPVISRSAAVERKSATTQLGTLPGGTPAANSETGGGAVNKTSGDVSLKDVTSEIGEAVRIANERLAASRQRLDIAVDRETGSMVVKITDTGSGEVVKQIPSEEALRLMRNIESLTGILVDHRE